MISNAPIQSAQTDASGLAALSWTGWYTQVAGALTAFDQTGTIRNAVTLNFRASGNQWNGARIAEGTDNNFGVDVNGRTSAGGSDTWLRSLTIASNGTVSMYNLFINTSLDCANGAPLFLNGVGNTFTAARIYTDGANNLAIDNQSGSNNWVNSLRISTAGAVAFPHPELLAFGSNFTNWTPAVSGGGSMIASGVVVNDATYIRVGPLVHFELSITFQLTGAASTLIAVSLPFTQYSPNSQAVTGYLHTSTSAWSAAFAFTRGSTLFVEQSGETNFPLGSTNLMVRGIVRVA